MTRLRLVRLYGTALVAGLGLAACDGQRVEPRGGDFIPDAGPPPVPRGDAVCTPARGSEDLQPRVDLTGDMPTGGTRTRLVPVSELFGRVRAACGGCHVDQASGNLKVDEDTFSKVANQTWLDRITSEDPKFFMPPLRRRARSITR